ncbi:MAG: molybdenum cofactor biosynthesis protein MoaE [Candidatus Nanopelagicales bacterium]
MNATTEPEQERIRTNVSDKPIGLDDHVEFVSDGEFGAVATFLGVVRNHDGGRKVDRLEYSSHPSADDVLHELALAASRAPGVGRIAISHRIGNLEVGDIALVAAVSSAHRGVAFEMIANLVEVVKAQLPIWKKQDFADGASEWVNSP